VKHVRTFAGVAAILLALVSIPVSNLGGFLVGFLLALVGGALAVSWVPGTPPEPQAVQEDTKGEGGAPAAAPYEAAPHESASYYEAAPHEAAPYRTADEAGEPNDLSGTSPVNNGANGRHSAG
jgi:hypothetical protein